MGWRHGIFLNARQGANKKESIVHIISLKAQNVKNLKAVEIVPEGHVVELRGRNGAGKSAVLDCVFTTLTGTRLEDPIRHGEDRAEVIIDMGTYTVRKRWTTKGEYLDITNKDGDKKQSPQAFLDKLVGKLTFDPLAFLNMKPKDQLDLLKSVVGLDFKDIDEKRCQVFDERTGVNARLRGAVAQLQNIPAPDPNTPDEEIKFTEALEEVNKLREKKKAFDESVKNLGEVVADISDKDARIVEIQSEIDALVAELKEVEKQRENLKTTSTAWVHPPEVTESQVFEAEQALNDIETKNVTIRSAKRYRELLRESEKVRQEADKLTERLNRLEQDKATRIAAAKMPIDGLSISDSDVMFEGVPFSRRSTGEQIRISTAIAMKLNPSLKTIFIREGSLVDDDGRKAIFDMAKDQGYSVWIEEVDSKGEAGIFIEAGEITRVDGKDVDAEESKE